MKIKRVTKGFDILNAKHCVAAIRNKELAAIKKYLDHKFIEGHNLSVTIKTMEVQNE